MPRDVEGAGKGDDLRPCRTGREERDLRYALALGLITREMFNQRYMELEAQGKITRDGRRVS